MNHLYIAGSAQQGEQHYINVNSIRFQRLICTGIYPSFGALNPLKPNALKKASYPTANLQILHFIHLSNKYTYWIF